ncbi:MAG: ribosome assembly RNA-binding protein YhbY [Erysipelotrichaceae bacterium]
MLSNTEKKMLRSKGMKLRAILQIGKEGISPNLINTIDDSLEAHELIKISMLKTSPIDIKEAAFDIASMTKSEVVQTIGHTMIIYRLSKKNKMEL